MGNEYWYPLYEKMVKMDIPGLVHAASCKNPRESFHGHFITEGLSRYWKQDIGPVDHVVGYPF